MNEERNYHEGVDGDFWEKFKSERLVNGSDDYRAVKEALEIARIYHLKYEPGSLSGIEKIEMEIYKNKIIEANNNSPIFIDKFIKICRWITTDLGSMPAIRILRRIEFLKDKIKETDQRTDLV